MKISREVCKAKDAGFVHYQGLPGAILSGCINTPAFESRYCADHKDYACRLKIAADEEVKTATLEDFVVGPITRAMARTKELAEIDNERIIERVLDKKATRSTTYYKV